MMPILHISAKADCTASIHVGEKFIIIGRSYTNRRIAV